MIANKILFELFGPKLAEITPAVPANKERMAATLPVPFGVAAILIILFLIVAPTEKHTPDTPKLVPVEVIVEPPPKYMVLL